MIISSNILSLLKINYPDAKIALRYSNNWELLVAVILSAQCTDIMVNKVTEKLFKKYKTIEDYTKVKLNVFENNIRSTGFYRNKAKNIIASAKIIIEKFNKKIPKTIDEMIILPGVARKTANVVLGNAYNIIEGIAVDTHVARLSQRLGLSKNRNPEKIEKDLMIVYNKKHWFKLTYLLIEHGRKICIARNPKCNLCFLNKLCPSAFKI